MAEALAKILIVDDDIALGNLFKLRLEMEGFDVEHVTDGEAALAGVEEIKPDAILLDLMLPRMSGFDVLSRMRQSPATERVKIVIFSALGDMEDRKRALDLGANDYIVKSEISLADLVLKLRQLLALPAGKNQSE